MKICFRLYFVTIITILNIICVFSQDCSSPADCYVKAIGLLKQDREEMKREKDIYQKLYEDLKTKMESVVNQHKSEMQELRNQVKSEMSGIKNYINTPWKNMNEQIGNFSMVNENIIHCLTTKCP